MFRKGIEVLLAKDIPVLKASGQHDEVKLANK